MLHNSWQGNIRMILLYLWSAFLGDKKPFVPVYWEACRIIVTEKLSCINFLIIIHSYVLASNRGLKLAGGKHTSRSEISVMICWCFWRDFLRRTEANKFKCCGNLRPEKSWSMSSRNNHTIFLMMHFAFNLCSRISRDHLHQTLQHAQGSGQDPCMQGKGAGC